MKLYVAVLVLILTLILVEKTLVMVVNSNGKADLCLVLADNVFVQSSLYFARLGEALRIEREAALICVCAFIDDLVADIDSIVADVMTRRGGDEEHHLVFRAVAKGTVAHIFVVDRHKCSEFLMFIFSR